ncbi:hypothetical protein SADUNF_Sadunf14G0065800 [Salix dunnii]|uniref:Cyanobacterial aminoacyl-tRNA synthetase CAAD domain-containing protein n=1 Tax=Salix dunnii TaxID=1413687 RepID=A0A835JI03_9ROSI|nr:hypothetical protein SADUNF_Sadunf14G0065800 [Salix dunnii]
MASTVIAAAASSSMAATAIRATRCYALPYLPPRSASSSQSFPIKQVSLTASESRRLTPFQTRASSSEESPVDANEIFTDLKEKWDAVENKSTVIIYGGGAVVAVWLSSILIGAVNSVPLVASQNLGAGGARLHWMVCLQISSLQGKRFSMFGLFVEGLCVLLNVFVQSAPVLSSRKELATDIEALKKKIAGTE